MLFWCILINKIYVEKCCLMLYYVDAVTYNLMFAYSY